MKWCHIYELATSTALKLVPIQSIKQLVSMAWSVHVLVTLVSASMHVRSSIEHLSCHNKTDNSIDAVD